MRWRSATEGTGGDTKIAVPLVRVDPGASTGLGFSADHPAMAGDAVGAVEPPARAHWRSNVSGLR